MPKQDDILENREERVLAEDVVSGNKKYVYTYTGDNEMEIAPHGLLNKGDRIESDVELNSPLLNLTQREGEKASDRQKALGEAK